LILAVSNVVPMLLLAGVSNGNVGPELLFQRQRRADVVARHGA